MTKQEIANGIRKRYEKRIEIEPELADDTLFMAIPALLDEVERLQADKNRISSESIMHQETINMLSKEVTTLTKALELACEDSAEYDASNPADFDSIKRNADFTCKFYIQKAKEEPTNDQTGD